MNRYILCLICVVSLMVAGTVAGAQESKGKIGLSVLTMTNPFFGDIAEAVEGEAAKHGYEVIVTSAEFDVVKQQNQVKDFLVQGVQAIILCPADSKAIGVAIKEANQAGVPVFTADIASLDPDAEVVAHVATNNLEGGKQAGKAMIEALNGQGKVAILDHPEVESVLLRTKGFLEVVNKANENGEASIEIVSKLPGGGARDKSFRAAEDLLQAHPDLDGIFAINDPSALGAAAAIEKAGKSGQIQIIGFDGQLEGRKAIRDGVLYADPIQFPDKIGEETVKAVVSYFQGEEVPKEILIPTSLYKQEDAMKDPSLN